MFPDIDTGNEEIEDPRKGTKLLLELCVVLPQNPSLARTSSSPILIETQERNQTFT